MMSNRDNFYIKVVVLVNCYAFGHTLVNCYALDPMDRYSILIFRILTMFDIIILESVCFQNSWYYVSFVFDFTAFTFIFYSNVKVENG